MKFLKKFFEYKDVTYNNPAKPQINPGTKPETAPPPTKKPDRPEKPSPLRRDNPSEDPNPKANSPVPAKPQINPGTKPETAPPPTKKPDRPEKPSPLRRDNPSEDPNPKAEMESATVDDVVSRVFDQLYASNDILTITDIDKIYKNK